MADKKRVFESAASGLRGAAAVSAATAAGEIGDDFTRRQATAAEAALEAERAKGRGTALPMERTLGRQRVVVAAEQQRR